MRHLGSRQGVVAAAGRAADIRDMNERELIERLGLPDEIVGPEDRLWSTAWICFTCGETTTADKPMPCPAPCGRCGGIMFQTWRSPCPETRRASER
jgi:hypothetical protein